ncbi:MAG: GAF domain-containing protein [bacterium]|nr:GAF domain-containing protein [bacterium]
MMPGLCPVASPWTGVATGAVPAPMTAGGTIAKRLAPLTAGWRSLRASVWLACFIAAATPLSILMIVFPGALPTVPVAELFLVSLLISYQTSVYIVRPVVDLERATRRAAVDAADKLAAAAPLELRAVAERMTTLTHERDAARRLAGRQARQSAAQVALRRALRAGTTSRALARSILHVLAEVGGARAGSFYLMRGGQVLELAAHCGPRWPSTPPTELKLGEGLAGLAAARRAPLSDDRTLTADGAALVAVPYQLTGRVKGVVVLAWDRAPTDADLEFLDDTSEPIAIALDARRARERVQLLLEETRRHASVYATQQLELQQTNIRLQRSDRYKNEFLANMTHELRSPLNSMLLLSQVLAENRHGHLAHDEVDAAQIINKAGRELLVIIDDILDLTKAEAGRLEIHPGEVQVSDLAESLAGMYRPLAVRRGLAFSVTVEPGAPTACVTDPTRLGQILKNLLNNALKFTEHGSVDLRIAASPEPIGTGPALDFTVTDTGIGISADVLPALFAAFTQGDGSIARRFGGSGLGLSICRKLAELLGARISVTSRVDNGSTFTLTLPLSPPASVGWQGQEASAADVLVRPPLPVAGASAASTHCELLPSAVPAGASSHAAVAGRLAGLSILVIDGDMRSVFRLTAVLEAAGSRVRVARDPAAGLARLVEGPPPRLVLTRPRVLEALPPAARQSWWADVAASGACLVVLSALIPPSADLPPGLPVLDPEAPAPRLCQALAGLASAEQAARQEVCS